MRRVILLVGVVTAYALLTPEPAMTQSFVETRNGQISTPRPNARSTWEWTEDYRRGEGYTLTEIKWRSEYKEGEVYLYAKDYAGVHETTASICGRDWRDYYRPVLPVVSIIEARQFPFLGREACNVVAEGSSSAGISLRLDEHYIVLPDHVLLLSAAGPTVDVLALQTEIDSWFSGVRFRTLQGL